MVKQLFLAWWNQPHNPYRGALTVNDDEIAQAAFIAGYEAAQQSVNPTPLMLLLNHRNSKNRGAGNAQ